MSQERERQLLTPLADSTLATVEHNHHEKIRSALSPFSTQTVHRLQSVVEERVDALLDALVKYARSHRGKPLNVMYPFSAFTYGMHQGTLWNVKEKKELTL